VSRSPALQSLIAETRRSAARVRSGSTTFSLGEMTPEQFFRSAFNIVLNRDPTAAETSEMLPALQSGALPRDEFVKRLRGTVEFRFGVPFEKSTLPHSLHMSRCEFIIGLPPARTILDIGGGDVNHAEGALVAMGYPYEFEALTIIDLPADERHPMYRSAEHSIVQSRRGPVSYRYHSMSDLSGYADESFDLVYSGQSIEHVTEAEVGPVIREVMRVLRPGGHFALDTPNGRITRLQQAAFIDADHKVEYTAAELDQKIEAAGFEVIERKGLNYAGVAAAHNRFDWDEAARNTGVFFRAEDCYLLAYVCRKPG
jgi:2-polyprenyl-3-methyl-5-hydroxy-6-metoxy-1,4-benzoquinol methylase